MVSTRIAGTISQPSWPVISFQPSAPLKIIFQLGFCLHDDAGQRLDHQRGLDAVGLELRAGDGEVGVDDGDVLAELDALGVGVDLEHLKLRAAHVGGELLALEIGERLDLVVLGEDHEVGKREAGAEDAQRHAFLIELLQDRRPADQHLGLAGSEAGVERRDRRIRLGCRARSRAWRRGRAPS